MSRVLLLILIAATLLGCRNEARVVEAPDAEREAAPKTEDNRVQSPNGQFGMVSDKN